MMKCKIPAAAKADIPYKETLVIIEVPRNITIGTAKNMVPKNAATGIGLNDSPLLKTPLRINTVFAAKPILESNAINSPNIIDMLNRAVFSLFYFAE